MMMMSEIYGASIMVIILMFCYSFLTRKYDLHLEYVCLKCKQTYFEEMCFTKKVIQPFELEFH